MVLDNSIILYLDWILIILMFLAFCQQLFSNRFNFYGILSILSISLYIAVHSLLSGINILVLILFISAILLIILEMFVPGGIMGILGIIVLVASIIIINTNTQATTFILLVAFVLFISLYLINIYIFKRKLLFLNRFILEDTISTKEGYVAKESEVTLIGQDLIAFTDLRPSGTATLNNEKYDVVTEGEFIEKGTTVRVINVEGMRIVVRKI